MSKENKVSRHDARLCGAAIDLAESYVDAELNPPDTRNTLATEQMHKDTNSSLFKAIKEEIDVGERDIMGLWRVCRKSRSLKLRGDEEYGKK